MRILCIFTCLAALCCGQKRPADVAGVLVPEGYKISGVGTADLNGDDLLDLVVTAVKHGNAEDRLLRVHTRSAGGAFPAKPDHELKLHRDFTAFLIADVLPTTGPEIVLLSGTRAVVWRPGKTGREQWVSLFKCKFLIQLPRNGRMVYLPDVAKDLNKDGALDFLVPLDQGYAVFLKQGEKFIPGAVLQLPPPESSEVLEGNKSVKMGRRSLKISLNLPEFEKAKTGRTLRSNLVNVSEWNWRPRLVDFNGDGKTDLLVRGSHEVYVWFSVADIKNVEPQSRFDVPVVADRSRLIDIAYSSHFFDLNGDKKTDSVMIAGDQRSEKPRTQILVFEQGSKRSTPASPLFGEKGVPNQLIVLAGFTGATDFQDVNGDGRLDLVIGSLRQDIIDKLRESSSERTEVEFYVYFNQGGKFSKSPDIRQTFNIKIRGLGSLKSGFLAKFMPDITGDGVGELAMRSDPEKLDIHYFRKVRGGGLEMLKKPLWSMKLARESALRLVPATKKEKAGILVVEYAQVSLVRF